MMTTASVRTVDGFAASLSQHSLKFNYLKAPLTVQRFVRRVLSVCHFWQLTGRREQMIIRLGPSVWNEQAAQRFR